MKSRLVRDGLFGPDLSLADTEHIFFVLLIDFDFPAIEVGLEHLNRIGSRIGDQQGSGLAIEPMPVIVIGQRGDDDQAEGPALSAAPPEKRFTRRFLGRRAQALRTLEGFLKPVC